MVALTLALRRGPQGFILRGLVCKLWLLWPWPWVAGLWGLVCKLWLLWPWPGVAGLKGLYCWRRRGVCELRLLWPRPRITGLSLSLSLEKMGAFSLEEL